MNTAHSIIVDYPIDYNKYPLAEKEKIFKVELNKNEYLVIPKYWFHWVYTEPNTIAVSYEIPSVKFKEFDNNFYKSIYISNPYKGVKNNIDFKYNDFINNSLNDDFLSIISETNDCAPVIKNNLKKNYYKNTLSNIIEKNKENYVYVGYNDIPKNSMLNSIIHITTLIDRNFYNDIYYKTTVWFTLDKIINSGLHHDHTNNILYVLDGKKTIYLLHPNSIPNLYKKNMPSIRHI